MFRRMFSPARITLWRQKAGEIMRLAERLRTVDEDDLLARAQELSYRAKGGNSLNSLLPEAFALGIEAATRTRGERHYPVQVMGGMAIAHGQIAQMQTGEGKTLTATLPAILRALTGRGVHVVTVNDYLAARDAEEMGPVYQLLGLSVGVVTGDLPPASPERREAYACDITYGTVKEFGFDFLRDRLAHDVSGSTEGRSRTNRHGPGVQRELNFALIDEADSVLLDEARTPLVLNLEQPADDATTELYRWSHELAGRLVPNTEFYFYPEDRAASLQPAGIRRVVFEDRPPSLLRFDQERLLSQIEKSLAARFGFHRDRDYLVREGDDGPEVVIIDESTGRPMEGRQWSEGLHQAIEIKEELVPSPEGGTAASVTVQTLYRQYHHLGGMTGTAIPSWRELWSSYRLPVAVIPTHRPGQRESYPTKIYETEAEKITAIVDEIRTIAGSPPDGRGRSVLVGTPSVRASENLSAALRQAKINHQVLNANRLAEEAEIVSHAGEPGRVTIATNMAGRGTDIKLSETVRDHGGLHVIATEMHSSARIDRQLIGRAARQGDPGSFRFFLSMEDELLQNWPSARRRLTFRKRAVSEGKTLPGSMIRWFRSAQRFLERMHHRHRRANLKRERERSRKVRDLGVDPFVEFIESV